MDIMGKDMSILGNIPLRMPNVHSKPQNGTFDEVTLAEHIRTSEGVSFSSMRVLISFSLVHLLEGGARSYQQAYRAWGRPKACVNVCIDAACRYIA